MKFSRSEQDLTLTGSRPPSACSTNRPTSAGRKGWYKKVANTSSADDMLFTSSAMKLDDATFHAPWEKKKGKHRQMLVWAPTPSRTVSARDSSRDSSGNTCSSNAHPSRPGSALTPSKTPKIKDTMLKTKHPYRLVKHNQTFVDETLFGPKLEEPSFVAPWNIKKRLPGEKVMARRPFHWDYSNYTSQPNTDRGMNGTRLNLQGLAHRPSSGSQPRRPASAREAPRPVWKP